MKVHHRDPKFSNRWIYYRSGRQARDEGQALTACPQLQHYAGDTYGAYLMKGWADGWGDRDLELKAPRISVTPRAG